jgi:hypothetical protein
VTGFQLTTTKGDFAFQFRGSIVDARDEARVAEMVAAMREGLEANGFNVEASLELSTKVTL